MVLKKQNLLIIKIMNELTIPNKSKKEYMSLSIKWCKYPEKNIENPFMDSRSEIERAA